LKKAILQLGPTGYPFERFVGELLKYQGYEAKVGQIVQGNCVQHEVDVVAKKGDTVFLLGFGAGFTWGGILYRFM